MSLYFNRDGPPPPAQRTTGGTYQVRGAELQLTARLTDGLTVQSSTSYNHSKQTNSPFLVNNNPLSPGYGQPITSIPNPFGPLGSPLANSPELQWNIRIRDEIPFGDYKGFWQVGAQHIGTSLSATGNVQAFVQEGYTTYDAAIGVVKDNWTAQLAGSNIGNSDAVTNITSGQFIKAQIPVRPRVLMFQLGYRF